jgi:DNA-binding NarL/FixJ family response regulator
VSAVLGAGAGEPRIPPSMAGRVLSEVDTGAMGVIEDLSPREREVLELMAEGRTNAAIARKMVVRPGAVEKHISNIFSKLDLPASNDDHRRVLAVLTFLQAGG